MNTQCTNRFVYGELGYVKPMHERAFQTMYEPTPGTSATNCAFDMRGCRIEDARQVIPALSLDDAGFTLLDAPS